MYFIIFICIVLIVKAILGMTYFKDNTEFAYYDNISNIVIGVLLLGYIINKMRKNKNTMNLMNPLQNTLGTTELMASSYLNGNNSGSASGSNVSVSTISSPMSLTPSASVSSKN